jgi:hypothetical protein
LKLDDQSTIIAVPAQLPPTAHRKRLLKLHSFDVLDG